MIEVVRPQPGQGWGRLVANSKFNGGDEIPANFTPLIDASINQTLGIGLLVERTPSVLLTFQEIYRADGARELMVHWCNDGRRPLKDTFDLLDAVTDAQPDTRFLAFCRRPALVRLLAARGWWLQSHEDTPFMALMVCQRKTPNKPE